ncbi:MAG: dTMP kinase [Halobacteriaceae archaeon]
MTDGVLIALEGIDGAGVTTQAERLEQRLADRLADAAGRDGSRTHRTKEPTDGPAGAPIRMALAERLDLDPVTLALLFAADRRDHVEQEIRPLLAEGYVVVTDRYHLSSYAYQLDGVDGDLDWLREINARNRDPDLTVLLDLDVEASHRRRQRDRVAAELFESRETLERVRQNYHEVAAELREEGQQVAVVDAARPVGDVADEVFDHATDLLREAGLTAAPDGE